MTDQAPEDLLALMNDDTKAALFAMQRLASELQLRQDRIQTRMNYVRGRQPIAYASEEFQRYMGDRFQGFADNWCLPIVQTPAERMDVQGIRLDANDLRPDREMSRVWRTNNCERGSAEAFVVGLAASRAFALVWGDEEDDDTPVITWERPEQAIVSYRPDTGRPVAGLKLWRDEDAGYEYATLYQADRVWKWQRRGVQLAAMHEPRPAVDPTGGWEPRLGADDVWPISNPMGMVPLVELRNQTLLDDAPMSDIDGVIAMQDAINLIWAYLFNALDYASLPQRVLTGAEVPRIPILSADGKVIGERPVDLNQLIKDRILWVPGDNVTATEWSAARLDVFSQVIERAIEHIAAQTRTPPHYLIGKVANLSAEALTAAETGLVSKTKERVVYFTPSIRRIFALTAAAQGNPERAKAALSGRVVWADVQFRSLAQKVDALHKMHSMGFPTEWVAEEYGMEPHEVARVMEMREREMAMDPVGALADQLERTHQPEPAEEEPAPPEGEE
ncbi:phage portal protein [Nocardiopsis exhalans]|uniref:Phage portal protein n=2 Tax=Nocardiopsis exhalans TaxID=163604 RepID=A0ABY5D7J7_9ACTN|nr:phage portal protein [Nocardiopsis exhalans]USY19716.1 phage portal protein [Nocardiopsis exhalans]